jgi:hypothetical protein
MAMPTMDIDETRQPTKSFDEQNSSISSGDRPSVTTTTLTNTSVWIHENSQRIEEELLYLEKQIQLLHEQDLVLTQIGERIHILDNRVKYTHSDGLSNKSSNDFESVVTNLGSQ